MVHDRVIVRRKSRIAFGAVLIAGAITMVTSSRHQRGDAALVVIVSWLLAIAAGWVVRAFAPEGPDSDRLGVAGLAVPIAGIALIGPLTLHMPFALLLGSGTHTFDEWVIMSAGATGPAHLAFVAMSMQRASRLVHGKPARRPGSIYTITIIVSCVPFIVLFAIPPLLVAFTGLPFLPILDLMERIAERERDELAEAPHDLPFAIARST